MFLLNSNLPNLSCKLRFIHAVPGAEAVDIYANGSLVASNASFGTLTEYVNLSPDTYIVELFKAGTYDTPLLKENVTILPSSVYTVSIVTNNSKTSLFKLKDAGTKTNSEISFLRFINLSPNSPLLTLSLKNSDPLFKEVEYLETTGYYPLSPGIYDFDLSFSDANIITKTLNNVSLVPGEFETLYVIGLLKGEPQLGYILSKDGSK
ncbi:DUF4397 domain-containing protein [Clostridium sp. Ade.TY]|uniref:DUF4397 domain-containing protein n=1 Tax=Clostridium sp. Ade.TY TaxID=1391647 RepID=UPI00042A0A86|nr:DUF4397 domain-containing protein [Clostridium sp. Ade.TY]